MLPPKFTLRGRRRLSDAVMGSLGELERKVMIEVRRLGETNVTHVNAALGDAYAYTTVMTTLDRLYKKGLLDRRKDGRAFLYTPRYSPEEMERRIAADIIGRLLETSSGRVEPVLACIVDSVSERDRLLLDELERLVREKRIELGVGE
jgi:predicted transcriptional regulator